MEEYVLMRRIIDKEEERMRSELFWGLIRIVAGTIAAAMCLKELIILAKKYFLN
jgi:hypothetical protein